MLMLMIDQQKYSNVENLVTLIHLKKARIEATNNNDERNSANSRHWRMRLYFNLNEVIDV